MAGEGIGTVEDVLGADDSSCRVNDVGILCLPLWGVDDGVHGRASLDGQAVWVRCEKDLEDAGQESIRPADVALDGNRPSDAFEVVDLYELAHCLTFRFKLKYIPFLQIPCR